MFRGGRATRADADQGSLFDGAAQEAPTPSPSRCSPARSPARSASASSTASRTGPIDLVIGTHALVQESVAFRDLSLAVVDEQHRFGLHQRMALKGKGEGEVDVLIMTATPIPRTLALTYYGDLDVAVLDELPPGRLPVRTVIVRTDE